MNDVMTAGMHRRWKDHFVSLLGPSLGGPAPLRVLDVAGGTGDIAFRILDSVDAARTGGEAPCGVAVTVLDVSSEMVDVGKARAARRLFSPASSLDWVIGNAEKLPFAAPEIAPFDIYTISFGLRNCTHIDRVLREAHRVLAPGGRLLCLELSPSAFEGAPRLRQAYDAFSFDVIPLLGQVVAGDRSSYAYLVESIRRFPPPAALSAMLEEAGFERVWHEALLGGVAVIHGAWKGAAPR